MILKPPPGLPIGHSIPRESGDDPPVDGVEGICHLYSPRERG